MTARVPAVTSNTRVANPVEDPAEHHHSRDRPIAAGIAMGVRHLCRNQESPDPERRDGYQGDPPSRPAQQRAGDKSDHDGCNRRCSRPYAGAGNRVRAQREDQDEPHARDGPTDQVAHHMGGCRVHRLIAYTLFLLLAIRGAASCGAVSQEGRSAPVRGGANCARVDDNRPTSAAAVTERDNSLAPQAARAENDRPGRCERGTPDQLFGWSYPPADPGPVQIGRTPAEP